MTQTRQLHSPARPGRARPGPSRSARIGSWTWSDPVVRAWVAIGLVPLFALVALGGPAGVHLMLGYRADGVDAPAWLDRATGLAGFLVFLLPCLLAVRQGNRARAGRDPRGWAPLAVGVLVGGWWLATGVLALAG